MREQTCRDYDRRMETRERAREIPWLSFPDDWQIKIIPPFGGATIRFRVKRGDKEVSVYLDFDDHLGSVGKPYWEIYPYADDTRRYNLDDTDGLLSGILAVLEGKDE